MQALLFYLPRMIWLSVEGGLMKFLVSNARGKIIEDPEEKRDSLIQTFQVIFWQQSLFNIMLFSGASAQQVHKICCNVLCLWNFQPFSGDFSDICCEQVSELSLPGIWLQGLALLLSTSWGKKDTGSQPNVWGFSQDCFLWLCKVGPGACSFIETFYFITLIW